jgi:hypothetical protein
MGSLLSAKRIERMNRIYNRISRIGFKIDFKNLGIYSGVNISKRNPEKRKRLILLSRYSQGRNLDRLPTQFLFPSPLSSRAARG